MRGVRGKVVLVLGVHGGALEAAAVGAGAGGVQLADLVGAQRVAEVGHLQQEGEIGNKE